MEAEREKVREPPRASTGTASGGGRLTDGHRERQK
jgi:hypothetical protein